jgi:hypothetical protein
MTTGLGFYTPGLGVDYMDRFTYTSTPIDNMGSRFLQASELDVVGECLRGGCRFN